MLRLKRPSISTRVVPGFPLRMEAFLMLACTRIRQQERSELCQSLQRIRVTYVTQVFFEILFSRFSNLDERIATGSTEILINVGEIKVNLKSRIDVVVDEGHKTDNEENDGCAAIGDENGDRMRLIVQW